MIKTERRFFTSKVSVTFELIRIYEPLYPQNIDVTSKQCYASQEGAIIIVSAYNMRYRMQINEYDWLPFVYHGTLNYFYLVCRFLIQYRSCGLLLWLCQ